MVLLRTNATTLADLDGHRTGNNIPGGKVLGGRGITFHETLTLRVEKVTSLTTRPLSNQATSTINTSWVELNKFKILQGKASTSNHGITITRASVRARTTEVSATVTASGKNGFVAAEAMKSTILHVESDYTNTLTILHDQVESEILNEIGCVVSKRLTIESMQDGVTSTVSSSGTAVSLATLSVFERLATKGTLIDLAFLCPGERNAIMFKLSQVELTPGKYINLYVAYHTSMTVLGASRHM